MSAFFSRFLSLSLFLLVALSTNAQEPYRLEIKTEESATRLIQKYKLPNSFQDSLTVRQGLRDLIEALQAEGYLLTSLDQLEFEGRTATAKLTVGERFEWLKLSQGNIEERLLRRIGFKEKLFKAKPFRYDEILRVRQKLLDYAEQNGHPFASLSFDSLRIRDNHFSAAMAFDPGPPITFDSVHVQGATQTKSSFLSRYLGIVMGEPYDQRRIDNIGRALSNLPYLRLTKNPILTFQNSEGAVKLSLENRRINQIDGIIGFLPNASDDNQLVVTGQFDVELYNPFGAGRHIGIHWQRLRPNSQSLALQYEQPNVFKGPLDLDMDFNFLKEDSLFTNRTFRLEFDYRLGAASSFSAFTNLKTTNLLATSIYENFQTLPDLVDFDFTAYGLRFQWQGLDDAFIPRRGMRFSLEGAVGNKKIRQNAGIADELYQGVQLKTLQYQFNLSAERYWQLGPQFVLFNRLSAGKIFNDRLFRNDAYRLGGFNNIRGFNENFFFATTYSLLTSEARFFLDELSYLSVFADWAWLESRFEGVNESQSPIGIGAGISFSTNAGIFNFVYALGSSREQSGFNLAQSKIHFGYISRF